MVLRLYLIIIVYYFFAFWHIFWSATIFFTMNDYPSFLFLNYSVYNIYIS